MVKFFHKVTVLVVLTCLLVIGLGSGAFAASWNDLESSALAAYSVTVDQISQVSAGYPDGTWQPWRSVTPVQFLSMLATGFNLDAVDTIALAPGQASNVVTREQAIGVVAGLVAAREGSALGSMSEEDITAALHDFGDAATISTDLRAAMAFAITHNLVKGNAAHNLAPKAILSRIASAALIIRAMGPQLRLSETDNGTTITVRTGDVVQVVLKGNPTTGFTWTATLSEQDASILEQMGEPRYVPDSQLIGSGGTFTFRFKALKAGEALLGLVYARPWESFPPLHTFAVTVKVANAPLEGTSWKLEGWSVSSLSPSAFEITALFKDGQISGKAAVNSYSGPYVAGRNGFFSVGALIHTLMAGSEEAMRAESLYFELLGQSGSYRLTGGKLTLGDANGNELLIFAPSTSQPATPVLYTNTKYGFTFSLPQSWEGYTIVSQQWEGFPLTGDGQSPSIFGPEILIRHPLWTASDPRQDIPIMVFTLAQWGQVEREELSLGAAPIPPSELGRNATYVFALPARYNFAFQTGWEEVETILEGHALKPIT